MKRFISVLFSVLFVLLTVLLPAHADSNHGYYQKYYGPQQRTRFKNWNKMLSENFARYQASYKNYAYQQAAQKYGNGGSLNLIQPGTIRKVLSVPIAPIRNNQPATVQTYSEKYGNQQTNLTPILINGQEYVLYQGRYIPVNND